MISIIPAILTSDPKELEEKLRQVAGLVNRVQIDVVDGQFVDNKTVDPTAIAAIDTDLDLDFHLMTKEPVHWLERCVTAGADRIIGQIEAMSDQLEFVGKVAEVGLSVGLAIDLGTPVDHFDPVVLTNLDVVLVMAVKAGFGGQKFDPRVLDKIKELDEIRARDEMPFQICVDGGINLDNIKDVHAVGADEVAVGTSLFEGELAVNLKRLEQGAHGLS